jgi:hypothetical protein
MKLNRCENPPVAGYPEPIAHAREHGLDFATAGADAPGAVPS